VCGTRQWGAVFTRRKSRTKVNEFNKSSVLNMAAEVEHHKKEIRISCYRTTQQVSDLTGLRTTRISIQMARNGWIRMVMFWNGTADNQVSQAQKEKITGIGGLEERSLAIILIQAIPSRPTDQL